MRDGKLQFAEIVTACRAIVISDDS